MFIEPHIGKRSSHDRRQSGWIEVICGSMFSGKTEELIRRLNRAIIAKQRVEIFKPVTDTRYHHEEVVSHDDTTIRSTPVSFADDILLLAVDSEVVGIDEAQFFDDRIVDVTLKLANSGTRVILAGLDMDYKGEPFGAMPALLAIAEYVTKVHAICANCGNIASFSFRLGMSKEKVMLGEHDDYEARCRRCFEEGMKNLKKG